MTTFDKREEAFEQQFAHDEELRFKAIAFDGFPIFDLRPVAALAETTFPGNGQAYQAGIVFLSNDSRPARNAISRAARN